VNVKEYFRNIGENMIHLIEFKIYKEDNDKLVSSEYFELSEDRWKAVKELVDKIE
jgi:hypothetical protein